MRIQNEKYKSLQTEPTKENTVIFQGVYAWAGLRVGYQISRGSGTGKAENTPFLYPRFHQKKMLCERSNTAARSIGGSSVRMGGAHQFEQAREAPVFSQGQ